MEESNLAPSRPARVGITPGSGALSVVPKRDKDKSATRQKLNQQRASINTWLQRKGDGGLVVEGYLGRGGFSVCWLLSSKQTAEKVALKVIDKHELTPAKRTFAQQELVNHARVEHPHVVRFYRYGSTDDNLILMFLEYCAGGSLLDLVRGRSGNRIRESEARIIVRQLTEVLVYLRSVHVVHRDIKLSNVLLATTESPVNIKLADFGLSAYTPYDEPLKRRCGTPRYLAPEIVEGGEYSYPVDVWGLGVLTYALIAGGTPFQASNDKAELYRLIRENRVDYPLHLSRGAVDFIRSCLDLNPEVRATAEQLLGHPWLAE